MHTFARAFVKRIGDDTDDLDVQFGARPGSPTNPLADRALTLEEMLNESAIDDRNSGLFLRIESA